MKRFISGVCYVALLLGFYLLKIYVNPLFFDLLIYAFAIVGTKEIIDAMSDRITAVEKGIVYAFTFISIPACALFEYFFGIGLHVTAILFFFLAVALLSLFVLKHDESTPEGIGTAFFCAVYPTIILATLILANHIGADAVVASVSSNHIGSSDAIAHLKFDSNIAIVFIFVASSIADAFAFYVGSSLKKFFPKKLAPSISPNKTIIGTIGGLLGGVVSGVALYFLYNWIAGVGYADMHIWLPIYMGIGLAAAAATAFGDLVESCIKRRLEVKDMGNIMPGHGGILDRLDGTMFAGVVVYLLFVLTHVIAAAI